MKRNNLIISFFLTALTLYSCKTDFEINADPQEIMVIYGLLDQKDTSHYIKITRAFLGDDDATIMAADPANSNYGDELNVRVEEWYNGNLMYTWTLTKTTITDKEDGTFYYPDQIVYTFNSSGHMLSTNFTYRLLVDNTATGKSASAETGLVSNFSVEKPLYNPANPLISFVTQAGQYASCEAIWESAINGRLYEPMIRFHYSEIDKISGIIDSSKTVDWILSSVKSSVLDGSETMSTEYNGESFYSHLQSVMPINPNVDRKLGKLDFIISVGGDELSTYIDLNRPSNSIIQERPAYTNISGGIGIFSCRNIKVISGFNLAQPSVEKLFNSDYTNTLGFIP